jgi:PAS domain S-box-containing protein
MNSKQSKHDLLCIAPVFLLIILICLYQMGRSYAQQAAGEFLAGVPANFPPHYSIDAQTGKPVGFAIDVMNEVAQRSGIKIRYVVYPTWAKTIEAVEKGEVVLIPNLGIVAERVKSMDFSSPIETFPIVISVREATMDIKGVTDLIGKVVAVVERNSGLYLMKKRGGSKLQIYSSQDEALLSLISGKSDALVYPEPPIKMLSKKTGLEDRIKIVGEPLLEVKRGIAVRKGNPQLLKKLDDEVIIFTKSPRYEEIYAKWYGKPEPSWTARRVAVFGGGFLAFAVITLIVWRYLSLHSLNRELQTIIEERKNVEVALIQAHERLRRFVEANIVGVVTASPSGGIIQTNDYYLRVIGYTREEFEQGMIDWRAITPPEWLPADEHAIEELREHGTCTPYEKEYGRRDGTRVSVFLSNAMLPGPEEQIAAFVLDITERKRAEEALQESERKYRELVENANSIILRWSRDGKITFMNEFGQQFFGYTEAEILGRHVLDTIVPETESTGRDLGPLMDRICANPEDFEQNINENMRRNGERVWIAWTNKTVLDRQGQVLEILSIGSNITERKIAEEELRKYRDHLEELVKERTKELEEARAALVSIVEDLNEKGVQLAQAMEQAQSADRLKSAFLATMSHELRTPLNSIIGFTGIVLQGMSGPLNEEQAKQLRMVQSSANHLLDLINDVLDISKIEAGQVQITKKPFDMRSVIEAALRTVLPLAAKKGLFVDSVIASDVGVMISDRRRVEQILINLVANAVKFTDRGAVRIECRINGDRLEICVRDTGVGIKPEDMGKIFKPFSQVETGLARNHEGTGLGLSICKKLVELLGGAIRVESEWGKGSTFTFTLPVG